MVSPGEYMYLLQHLDLYVDLYIWKNRAMRKVRHSWRVGDNWCINNLFVGPSVMTSGLAKGGKLWNVIAHNVILANQKKIESAVYRWLRAHAMFDITWFPTFVGASDVISSVLSIHLLHTITAGNSGQFWERRDWPVTGCVVLIWKWKGYLHNCKTIVNFIGANYIQ